VANTAIDVFGYLDYRSFLRDLYAAKKARGRGFSFRAFSRRAGLSSPNYLKLVMDGERNLTAEMAERFAAACDLKGDPASFFCALVGFNQAKTPGSRGDAYERMLSFRRYRQARKLEVLQLAYYSTWYLPAIRELAARRDFQDDPAWIARTLVPSITAAEASQALATLLQLGLLSRTEDGRLRQSESIVTTGPEVTNVHVASFHRSMIGRGAAAIDVIPAAERDISSLTLCLSADGLRQVKARIQRFRQELLQMSELEVDPEQVTQINFQLFPLSRRREQEPQR
jgi:uncharacterized protein (TIGR02147 family)